MENFSIQASFLLGLPIWILILGGLLCLLIDSIWPKKMTTLVFSTGILSLFLSLVLSFKQWAYGDVYLCETFQSFQALGWMPQSLQTGTCSQTLSADLSSFFNSSLLMMDAMTLFLFVIISLISIITLLNSLGYLKIYNSISSEFSTLLIFSTVGMFLLFSADHLILNYIGLEIMSFAVYVLGASQKQSLKSSEAGIKYYVLGGVTSAIILYGIALFYGGFGTMRLSLIASQMGAQLAPLQMIAVAMLLFGLLFKLSIAPFHFWVPDVYEGAPAPVTGFMSTAVKTAVFGLTLRVFTQLEILNIPQVETLLTALVVLTLIVGNLSAISQSNIKRMLAYSSVSHAGFMMLGVVAGFQNHVYQEQNIEHVLFYLFAYFLMTLGAFAVLSFFTDKHSEKSDFSDLAGFGKKNPVLAIVLSLFLLSLLGLPGTVGFTAKYNVLILAVKTGKIPLAIFGVLISVISTFYYLKPIAYMFFMEPSQKSVIDKTPWTLYSTITFCAIAVILFGVKPDTFIELSHIVSYDSVHSFLIK